VQQNQMEYKKTFRWPSITMNPNVDITVLPLVVADRVTTVLSYFRCRLSYCTGLCLSNTLLDAPLLCDYTNIRCPPSV